MTSTSARSPSGSGSALSRLSSSSGSPAGAVVFASGGAGVLAADFLAVALRAVALAAGLAVASPSTTVGDVVVVKLKVKAPDESSHLMVSDALPGGFEALNTRLATVGGAGVKQSRIWWGNYREMHDERVDFASEYVYDGDFEYVYSIRAIAVGKFARPPAVAELMYEPSKRAQTGFDYIEVKPK